ncbi:MAG: hypothetical protein ACRDP7_34150, partial [Trebonia sp.]
APRSWAAPSPPPAAPSPPSAAPSPPSVASDTPTVKSAVKPGPGSGSAAPSWFDRLGGHAGAGAPAATSAAPTVASGIVSGAPGSGDQAPGDQAPGDTGADGDDDDWPTRYSWLDDDTDEGGEASPTVASVVADAEPESKSAGPADTARDAGPDDVAPDQVPANDVAPVKATATGASRSATETADAATPDAGAEGAAAGDPASTARPEEPHADIIAFPGSAAATAEVAAYADDSGEPDDDATAASETGTEPPATQGSDAAPGADLVTVVPGVPRYHRSDCVLIRFMPEGDIQKLSIAAAKDTGCTPCAACQPEG